MAGTKDWKESQRQHPVSQRPAMPPKTRQVPSDAPASKEARERDTYRSKEKVPTPSNAFAGV